MSQALCIVCGHRLTKRLTNIAHLFNTNTPSHLQIRSLEFLTSKPLYQATGPARTNSQTSLLYFSAHKNPISRDYSHSHPITSVPPAYVTERSDIAREIARLEALLSEEETAERWERVANEWEERRKEELSRLEKLETEKTIWESVWKEMYEWGHR